LSQPITDVAADLERTRAACETALLDPALAAVNARLEQDARHDPGTLIAGVSEAPDGQSDILAIRAGIETDQTAPHALERVLLLRCALQSLEQVPTLPVSAQVKAYFFDSFRVFANPPANLLDAFEAGHYPFVAFSKIASLRRCPAGQFDWETSGVPRSFFLKARWRDKVPLLMAVVSRLGGRNPMFMPHFSIFRRHWLVLRRPEVCRSYYQMALALQQQPRVRGMVATSWFYSEDTYTVSPHLSWLRSDIVQNGGFAALLGRAPAEGGVLRQGIRRRELFEKGEFAPREGLVLWPRDAMLDWAARHPEFA
jgi:hypothetical protein